MVIVDQNQFEQIFEGVFVNGRIVYGRRWRIEGEEISLFEGTFKQGLLDQNDAVELYNNGRK